MVMEAALVTIGEDFQALRQVFNQAKEQLFAANADSGRPGGKYARTTKERWELASLIWGSLIRPLGLPISIEPRE